MQVALKDTLELAVFTSTIAKQEHIPNSSSRLQEAILKGNEQTFTESLEQFQS